MSLINDALKRAKEAQQEAPPTPMSSADLRPVEARHYGRPSIGLAIPVLLGVASVVLLFMLWQTARHTNSQDLEVKARTKPAPVAPVADPAPAVQPAPEVRPTQVVTATVAVTNVVVPAPATALPTNNPVAAAAPADAASNVAPVVAVAPPKPALPRLQAIVFNPQRPSVMLSGKTLFVGDKIGEYRVRKIDQETVTLVSATQTNVLALPE